MDFSIRGIKEDLHSLTETREWSGVTYSATGVDEMAPAVIQIETMFSANNRIDFMKFICTTLIPIRLTFFENIRVYNGFEV